MIKKKLLYKTNYEFFNSDRHEGSSKMSCISYSLDYLKYAFKKLFVCMNCIFYEPFKNAFFCFVCKEKDYNGFKKITKRNMKKRPKYILKFVKKNLDMLVGDHD